MNTSTAYRTRRPLIAVLMLQGVSWGAVPSVAQETNRKPPPARRTPEDIYAGIVDMNESVKKLGPWKDQYADMVRSMNNLWRQNGWDDEADRYALNLALEVGEVPPWEFTRRMEVLTGRMRERYGMTESEAIGMRGKMVGEIGGMLFRHAGVIFEQVGQYVELRAHNEPLTPDLIAEWTEGSDDMWADIVKTVHRVTGDIRETLGPEQQKVIDRDLASFRRRAKYWDEKRKVWRKGGWKAEDWGMQDDPIQMGLRRDPSRAGLGGMNGRLSAPQRANGVRGAKGVRSAGKWLSYDPNTWMSYVNHVARRYDLDEAQRNTCRTLHKDKFDRAAAYAKAHEEVLAAISVGERAKHDAFEPIRSVFVELQRQLEAIPTPKQKREVKP